METSVANTNIPQPQYNTPTSQMQYKDVLIFILVVTLIFTILGINLFAHFGHLIQYISDLFKPLIAFLGYATGTTINTTADLTSDTAKFGIDVAEGAVQDIGNLLISASDKNTIPDFKQQYNKYSASLIGGVSKAVSTSPQQISNTPSTNTVPVPVPVPIAVPTPAKTVDETINTPPPKYMKEVSADTSNSNIQNTLVSKKSNWCLIGEYKDRRGCIEIEDSDRCISGQIFPSQQMCLQPTFSNNN